MSVSKQFSIRLPMDLARKVEAKGKVSPFIVEAVQEKLEREHRDLLRQQLQCLADDEETQDISDFKAAQRKVMTRGD